MVTIVILKRAWFWKESREDDSDIEEICIPDEDGQDIDYEQHGLKVTATERLVIKLPALYQSKFSFTLVERRKFHTAIQIFKSIHQKLPSYLHNIFHYSRDITGHIGRNINRLFVPRVNNNYGKRSFYYRGAMIWNSLPSTVTEATNLSKFVRLYHDKFS